MVRPGRFAVYVTDICEFLLALMALLDMIVELCLLMAALAATFDIVAVFVTVVVVIVVVLPRFTTFLVVVTFVDFLAALALAAMADVLLSRTGSSRLVGSRGFNDFKVSDCRIVLFDVVIVLDSSLVLVC